ncbi:hypothetical protein NE237_022006 [Protea cynaroides]|uniref:PGG domain-containing protein n=1 Tax=Protea cynaroides TaxID=273540 RepID=A0A9Q0HBA1_9MAGN|nr:hypothetical protein NE237_022006 [Protea cynaroides]
MDPNLDTLMKAAEKGDEECLYGLLGRDSSILDRADQEFRDNPLHVAVSNNQKDFVAEIANLKPSLARRLNQHGLSPLHIAAENGKNLKIVKLLLCDYGCFIREAVKINKTNNSKKTAFDVLTRANGPQTQPEEEIGEKMRKILQSKGATSANDTVNLVRRRTLDSGIKWLRRGLNFLSFFEMDTNTSNDVRNALLVIYILIVTATYTTVLNPPGGFWPDDYDPSNDGRNNSSTLIQQRPHTAGRSIWLDKYPHSFLILMLFNYAGFLVSIVQIFYLTKGYPLRGPILVALFLMLITYGLSVRLLFLGLGSLTVLFHGMILTIPLPVALVLYVTTADRMQELREKRERKKPRKEGQDKDQVSFSAENGRAEPNIC